MQIVAEGDLVVLKFPDKDNVFLTIAEAEMLRPDLGPAVREGKEVRPRDYLQDAIAQARHNGHQARLNMIAYHEAELRKLRGQTS